jgi:mono/diheme cytochrome c family protein
VIRVLTWAVAGLVIVATVIGLYVWRNWDRSYAEIPAPDLLASTEPTVIARGEYLVFGPAHCVECHVSDFAQYEKWSQTGVLVPLSGGYEFPIGPLGTLYSKNLTPDGETGIGRYTDPQVARMLRHGVRPDGQASIPLLMPFGNMSDDDIVAILSFLRSQPARRNVIPPNRWTTLGKVMRTFVAAARPNLNVHPSRTAPPQAMTAARGEYLARSVANCGGCHTAFNQLTGAPTVPTFSGGNLMEPAAQEGASRSAWFRPPNITPRPGSALMKFPDRATFVARFKVGGRHYPGSPMPWEAMARMAPEDVGALYEFLHSTAPAGEPSPEDPRVMQ